MLSLLPSELIFVDGLKLYVLIYRSIITDGHLQVKGSNNTIFAIGDACTIEQKRALEYADELFEKADTNNDGELQLSELRSILKEAGKQFPQFQEYALFFER